tara:strand:+ start:322 stop:636 length:315 start_codon:yes stop_codon:yes gene_type:complete
MKLSRLPAFCAVVIAITGCSAAPLEKAFEGEFAEVENNKIIFEYCQSCHVHKDLIPASHVSEKNDLYKSSKFRETKECRTCHYINENFFGDIERKTIKPRRGKI